MTGTRRHLLAALVLVAGVVVWRDGHRAGAHSPHDQATDLDFPADHETTGTVFAVVRGRLLRSNDGGATWHELPNGLPGERDRLRDFAVSAVDPNVAYVVSASGRVYGTEDRGDRWELLSTPGARVRRVITSTRSADTLMTFGGQLFFPTGPVFLSNDRGATWQPATVDGAALAASEAVWIPDTDTVVAADQEGNVYRSETGGSTFTLVSQLDDGVSDLETIAADTLLAVTLGGELLTSSDQGASFTRLGDRFDERQIRSATLSSAAPEDGTIWLTQARDGPLRSTDGGASFEPVPDGLTFTRQATDTGSSDFNEVEVAPDGSRTIAAGFEGLFVLPPDAVTWQPVETLSEYLTGLDVSLQASGAHTVAVATYVKGALISRDGGGTWDPANDGISGPPGNGFAPVERLYAIHLSPNHAADGHIFATTGRWVLRSTDAGGSWEQISDETVNGPTPQLFVLALSPHYAEDRTIWLANNEGGLFRSTDAGDPASWEPVGDFGERVRSLAVSGSRPGSRTIYVGTVSRLHRSRDDGATWTEVGVANEATPIGRESDVGIQVALSATYETDGTAMAATDRGVRVTRDHGETWTAVSLGDREDVIVEAVALSPDFADDGVALVSTRELGLLRSEDAGRSFEPAGAELAAANLVISDFSRPASRPIVFSPDFARDQTVFAFAQTEIVRSTDGGRSWDVVDTPSGDDVLASLAEEPTTADGDGDGDEGTPSTTTRGEVDPVDPASGVDAEDAERSGDRSATLVGLIAAGLAVTVGAGAVIGRRRTNRRSRDIERGRTTGP